jgi:hypothetical protein
VWEGVVFLPFAILALRSGAPLQVEELVTFFLPIAFCGVLVIPVCSLLASNVGAVAAVSLGALSGVILMVANGFVWAHIVRGFEASAGTFAMSLRLAIPSAVGAGVVAWLNSRGRSPK